MPLKTCMYMTVILTFEFVQTVHKGLWCDHSNESYTALNAFSPSFLLSFLDKLSLYCLLEIIIIFKIIINNTWLINKPGKHFPTFKVLKISPHRCCSGTISGWSCFIFCQYFLTSTPSHERLPLVLKKLRRKMFIIKQKVVGKCWKSHSEGMALFFSFVKKK